MKLLKMSVVSYLLSSLCRYFEGRIGRRLPKSHFGIENELEVAGMAIAHSMLAEGPMHCPALHPGLYKLLSIDAVIDENSLDYLPEVEDIPVNAQTGDLITLIKEVRKRCMYYLLYITHIVFLS